MTRKEKEIKIYLGKLLIHYRDHAWLECSPGSGDWVHNVCGKALNPMTGVTKSIFVKHLETFVLSAI